MVQFFLWFIDLLHGNKGLVLMGYRNMVYSARPGTAKTGNMQAGSMAVGW
jgi:hypothetical protein